MVLLQHKLNLKVTQKQILTPGLVQMVSVLALNKLELKDMINAEMVENPVLEELDGTVPLLDEVASKEEERDRVTAEDAPVIAGEKKDPFDEIDFGSFFQEYLDPGYRSPEGESVEKPSFENFITKPTTLTDHLMWQLGALHHVTGGVRAAAELIIGNLGEDGYLLASEEELLAVARPSNGKTNGHAVVEPPASAGVEEHGVVVEIPSRESAMADLLDHGLESAVPDLIAVEPPLAVVSDLSDSSVAIETVAPPVAAAVETEPLIDTGPEAVTHPAADVPAAFTVEDLQEALNLVHQMDPPGVAARDVRECLLLQLRFHQQQLEEQGSDDPSTEQVLTDAVAVVADHLRGVQNKQLKEIAKALGRPIEAINSAVDYIRTLDPRPGLRYNTVEPRLIEPDVAFVKQGDEYLVLLNDDDVPQLRLNTTYKRLLSRDAAEKDVRNYVKERYKSAIQLIKNIEQRKQTILKVCYAIVGRQKDFLDQGIDQLKPMMIKEVAEEIGVHPSTVSRAVANKYAHTSQGVFELRYFFSESVNGPEGGNTSLLILKRRVKKLIEEEDSSRPLTDEQITRILQSQGIQVTRRTVAKYREDMNIPSTHQRRVKN